MLFSFLYNGHKIILMKCRCVELTILTTMKHVVPKLSFISLQNNIIWPWTADRDNLSLCTELILIFLSNENLYFKTEDFAIQT